VGTNVAVLNGLMHLVIKAGHIDRDFIARHTDGFERLEEVVSEYPPERVRDITGIPAARLKAAAKLISEAPTLVSTVLQGVYQSHQASAAACQVNNLNLIRGMIGRPGCGVLQMNGQPTAQNTRECGCDGEFPGFRNWQNPDHVKDLARRWNVDPETIPHWHEPAHAMEIFHHAETGSVKFLWIIGTNPAVSLPELSRIRDILTKDDLFVIVQDAFMTETARMADVVLPAAIWGEKTGTFTNSDRTVHISHRAIDPPGEARSDLDIFLDFALRMDFRDKDGNRLVKWHDPEGAFEHWKMCSKGWPCDYSGLSYAKLSGASGIQYPCNEDHPDGTPRLYTDFRFQTAADTCETFGHDLETGAARTPDEYRANDPKGKALLKPARYQPPLEEPDDDYPFLLTTGRLVYHFHTRTKTARSKELQQAAPGPFLQMSRRDTKRLGVRSGELVEITSRRGLVRAPVRVGDIEDGHVFLPFHYGNWDGDPDDWSRAANELTLTAWDPVSKQPCYKYAAVQVRKPGRAGILRKAADVASKAAGAVKDLAISILTESPTQRSHVSDYLGMLRHSNEELSRACLDVASRHPDEPEIQSGLTKLAKFSDDAIASLEPHARRHDEKDPEEPGKLRQTLFPTALAGSFALLRDLHELHVLASHVHTALTIVVQAARGLRDAELLSVCASLDEQSRRQQAWLLNQIKHRATHTLVVPQ
jgi:anaerobic selenocysteine-containing dehydrogenase